MSKSVPVFFYVFASTMACAPTSGSPTRTAWATQGSRYSSRAARAVQEQCRALLSPADPTVVPPVELKRVEPYPSPRDSQPSGFVCVEATVTAAGVIADPKIRRTDNPAFARAFLVSLEEWRYKPATRDGVPVAVPLAVSAIFERMDYRNQ